MYSDGPKSQLQEELDLINECRSIVKGINWCGSVEMIEREENYGLSNSIISGVGEVMEKYGEAIVLEDDLEISPFFLKYMNDALEVYRNERGVLSVGACNFFLRADNAPDTFFIPIPDCLGWATWVDRWELFEKDSHTLLEQLTRAGKLNEFNLFGAFDFVSMLRKQAEGKVASWAIRWQAVSYLSGRLNLYPGFSLTNHIGVGSHATNSHSVDYSKYVTFPKAPIVVTYQPVEVKDSIMAEMIQFYRTQLGQERKKTKSILNWLVKVFTRKRPS